MCQFSIKYSINLVFYAKSMVLCFEKLDYGILGEWRIYENINL